MKKFKKLLIIVLLILSFSFVACDKKTPDGGDPSGVVDTTYKVTLVLNNGSSNQEIEVKEGNKLSNVTNPTRAGYNFMGWYSDRALTTKFNFDTKITSNISIYAKWEENNLDPNVEYGVVENGLYIPTNLEFSKDSHTSAKHTTANASSFAKGQYATNFNNSSEGTTIDGIKYSCYRYGKNSDSVIIKPDNSHYNETLYHGREGGLFNVTPFGGINKFEITYTATSPETATPTKPNIRFGKDDNCLDYVYFLEPTSTKATETIDVNLSMYQYFSINSGDYTCYVTSFSIDYDNSSTTNPVYEQTSGEGKTRINPITYNKSLVAGESKITAPIAYEYDEATHKYKVTQTKEFTYYTADYVKKHSEVKDDATITDPLEVCIYYTLFNRWPANYSKNVNGIQSTFGSSTRKVSEYSRTDGYCRAIPWNGNGVYYELDIDVDGSYSTSSRGVGRVVVWERGWTATGYDSSPVCIYTDDHYNTFIEYLNNGTWSNRFNAEGRIASISYSTAPTVTFDGFDANIVEGQGGTGGDVVDPVVDNFNHQDYYANYAPADMINSKTAKWQQVTTYSGIVEGNQYELVYGTGTLTRTYSGSGYLRAVNGVLEFDESTPSSQVGEYQIDSFYFEKSGNGYYMYKLQSDEKVYYGYGGAKKDLARNTKTLWTVQFSQGNIILTYDNNALQYNSGNWRTYSIGSQQPIVLYRFCDIEGATPDEGGNTEVQMIPSEYKKVYGIDQIDKYHTYILVNLDNKKCLTDLNGGKYEEAELWLYDLQISADASFEPMYFAKHTSVLGDYYEIYVLRDNVKYYMSYSSENYSITFTTSLDYYYFVEVESDGTTYIKFGYLNDEGNPTSLYTNNTWWYLAYDSQASKFVMIDNKIASYQFLYKLEIQIEMEEAPYKLVGDLEKITEEDSCLLLDPNSNSCLTDKNEAIYKIDSETNVLSISKGGEYEALHFVRHSQKNNDDYYEIYVLRDDVKYYLVYDKVNNEFIYSSTTSSYFMGYINSGRKAYLYVVDQNPDVEYTLMSPLSIDGVWVYLGYDSNNHKIIPPSTSNITPLPLYKYVKPVKMTETTVKQVESLDDITETGEFLIVDLKNNLCLTDVANGAYDSYTSTNGTYLKTGENAVFEKLHFEKVIEVIPATEFSEACTNIYYKLYVLREDVKYYISYNKETYEICYSTTEALCFRLDASMIDNIFFVAYEQIGNYYSTFGIDGVTAVLGYDSTNEKFILTTEWLSAQFAIFAVPAID